MLLIGEIRDSETADIAVKFALTGHLVFSTVHANDAPGTITGLLDIGDCTLSCWIVPQSCYGTKTSAKNL